MKYIFVTFLALLACYSENTFSQDILQVSDLTKLNKHGNDSVHLFAWVKDIRYLKKERLLMFSVHDKGLSQSTAMVPVKCKANNHVIDSLIHNYQGKYIRVDGLLKFKEGKPFIKTKHLPLIVDLNFKEPPGSVEN